MPSEAAVKEVPELVRNLYSIVQRLESLFPGRPFTLDGHLLGSIGEVLAAYRYGLDLTKPSTAGCDAASARVGQVEIKTTQGNTVAFRCEPPHLIVFYLNRNGTPEEIFNGPGDLVWPHVGKMRSNGQCTISVTKLRALDKTVPARDRLEVVRQS